MQKMDIVFLHQNRYNKSVFDGILTASTIRKCIPLSDNKKAYRSSQTFRRLIVSYFCVFLIPFLVLCTTTLVLVGHYSNQETVTAHAQWVALMMEDLERFEKTMTDIQMTLQYDATIQSNYSPAQYMPSLQLIQKLSALKKSSSDIRTLWYMPADSDYLYSDTSTLSAKALMNLRYQGLAYDEDSLREAVAQGTMQRVMKVRDLQQGDDVLLFSYPLLRQDTHSSNWQYHYVLFAIPEARLKSVLGRTLTDSGIRASLYIGDYLLCQTTEDAQKVYRSRVQSEAEQSISVGENMVLYSHSASYSLFCAENGEWRLEVSVQNPFAAQRAMLMWVMVFALVILGVGLYFSFLIARSTYAPIASIKRQSAQLVENENEDPSYNDFAVINQHLLQMSAQREKLQQEMSISTDVMENFLCYSLLYGHFDNLRSFHLPDSVRMQLSHARLRVLFLLTPQPAMDVRAKLTALLDESVSFWCTSSARPEGVVVLLAYRGQQDEHILGRIQELADGKTLIGLSAAGEDLSLIPLMTIQAVFALNRKMLASGQMHEYASASISQQLLSETDENAENGVGTLMQNLTEQKPIEADKAYRLLNNLMRFLEENPAYASGYIPCLSSFLEPLSSVQEARMADLLALGPVLEKHARPLADEPVLTQMRRYIEMHYMESEFSFKNMASDFSMSESGLSNYFKKHCGQSLMDYLTDLRIHQAINLLDNTDISIQDIGALVGYINPNSFIRRFKQLKQMTPGEYRRSCREEP